MWLNDELIGEIGMEARLASYFKLPTILVGGDVAACREAKALLPDVVERDFAHFRRRKRLRR